MPGVPSFKKNRCILFLTGFMCFFVLSSQRINMSVAILCMVNWAEVKTANFCLKAEDKQMDSGVGEFSWSLTFQSQVLVSYFIGLILMHLPAELLVECFPPKYIAFVGMLLSSLCSLLTPEAARLHIIVLIMIQIFKAMGHAAVLPAFSVMFALWIPSKRLLSFISFVTSGLSIGAFLTLLLTGVTCSNPNYSWPFTFHFTGAIGMVWCLLWLYLCCDVHFMPTLRRATSGNIDANYPKRNLSIPYAEIFSSRPFWGYVAAGVASYWILAMNIFVMPTYFRSVFNIDNEWNGILSSFPNVLQAFLYQFSFTILRRKFASKTCRRKTITCTGISAFSVCIVLLTFVHCNRALGILLMSIGVGFSGCNHAAISLIAQDMSPNFSGILSGIMNTIGSFVGCALPYFVGWFIDEEATIRDWEKVFYASFFVTFIGMILFVAYCSCDVQPWNIPELPSSEDNFIPLPNFQDSFTKKKRISTNRFA